MLDSNTCEARPKTTSEALCDYWHPIARSTEVTDKPVKAKLLDQPLVLWRSNGRIAVFYDLCIHRGTPLSLGWVDNAELVCALSRVALCREWFLHAHSVTSSGSCDSR